MSIIDEGNMNIKDGIDNLDQAIEDKNKCHILKYYEEINLLINNTHIVFRDLLEQYDELVSEGNDILYA